MKIKTFKVEEWMNAYEKEAIYDIAKRLGHSTTRTTEQIYAYEFKKHRDLMNQKMVLYFFLLMDISDILSTGFFNCIKKEA